jgi:hypothetical protein
MIGGHICKHCGNDDRRVLQIDHVWGNGQEMPLTKSTVLDYYLDNIDMANEELQMLCCNCHRIKSLEHHDLGRPKKNKEILISRKDIPQNNNNNWEWFK